MPIWSGQRVKHSDCIFEFHYLLFRQHQLDQNHQKMGPSNTRDKYLTILEHFPRYALSGIIPTELHVLTHLSFTTTEPSGHAHNKLLSNTTKTPLSMNNE